MQETTPKRSLFNITTDFMQLMNEIEANEGFLTEETEKALEISQADLETKSLNYIEFIDDRTAFGMRIDTEIKRLQAMKKANKNLIDRLKGMLLFAVEQFGEFTTNGGLKKIGTRKSESLIIDDEEEVPKKFQIVEVKLDKAAIKAAIKAGEEVPGAHIQQNKNLSIR